MKYTEDRIYPQGFYSRVVLAEEDAKSLLWLCKIKISGLVCLLFLFSSCYKKPRKGREDFIDHYHGVVIDENKKPLGGVEVCVYNVLHKSELTTKDSLIKCETTNNDGYFKIQDSTFTKHLLMDKNVYIEFKKDGYKLYRMPTIFPESGYRPKISETEGMFFMFSTPDTVDLRKETVRLK